MKSSRYAVLLCLLGAVLGTLTPIKAQDSSPESPSIPPEVEQYASDWPLPNHDYANTRANFDAEIDSSNVDTLEPAWFFDIPGVAAFGGAASNPLILGERVIFQDLTSNVFALDLQTGDVIWEHIYDLPVLGPNGPAVGYGKVFAIASVDEFAALDLETGEEIWNRSTGERPTGAFQPTVFGDIAYMTTQAGLGGYGDVVYRDYEGGSSGHIFALDQETGETIWDFQVVEEGFWGNPEVNSGGGIWYPPGIDVETGMTFWATGNPAPFPGTVEFPNGTSRPGPNLYTNSILAFDRGGEMVWYYQAKPHDLFDLDFQIPPILTSIEANGEDQAIVIGSGKLGRVVALDRATGEVLWDTPVGRHENDELDELPLGEVVMVFPGIQGGVETPMAYADGVVYAPVVNRGTPYTATGWDAETGGEAVARAEARTDFESAVSELVAIDVSNGEILWSTQFDGSAFGGATIVNDLVFTSSIEGIIRAMSRDDGEIIWEYQAPGGIIAWPAVTGDTILFPVGIGDQPVLMALRLANDSQDPGDAATPVPTPWG